MATSLSLREKIAHAYRRLGFGATPAELDEGVRIGLDATLKKLIDFPDQPAEVAHPFEFVFRQGEEADPNTYRFRIWWAHEMISTPYPLREKLALMWHSHLAVGDAKVENGPMMLGYLQTLRRHAIGRYDDLVIAISKDPAMMRYLDMVKSIRGRPNENFAREVMELFTMGIGNYTEQDVKELSRALTGRGMWDLLWEMPGNWDKKFTDALNDGRLFASYVEMPAFRDSTEKTVLGVKKDWQGDDAIEFLCSQEATSRRVSKRLWTAFGTDEPDEAMVKKLASAFIRNKRDIRKTLWSMVRMPEFWSEKCVRQLTKSPIDFMVPIARQLDLPAFLATKRDAAKVTPTTPVAKEILDESGYIVWNAELQGLNLLNPPDVSGWKGGRHWISPAAMARRYAYNGQRLWSNNGPDHCSLKSLEWMKSKGPKDSAEIAVRMCELFDVPPSPAIRKGVAELFDAAGGVKALENPNAWTDRLYNSLKLFAAAPEMHLA